MISNIHQYLHSQVLVSPAPAGGRNTAWFDPFFAACEELGCRIDYLATHNYQGEVEEVMADLEFLYNRLINTTTESLLSARVDISRYGRKIWLTEFAVCCTHDQSKVTEFVKVRSHVAVCRV